MHINPIDIGVRVEVPVEVMKELTDVLYEVKLEYTSQSFQRPHPDVLHVPGR